MKYKLNRTLYSNDYAVEDCKYDDDYELFAKKGQVFEIYLLTDKLREEYGVNEEIWKYIAISSNGCNWITFQDDDESLCKWFDKIGGEQ